MLKVFHEILRGNGLIVPLVCREPETESEPNPYSSSDAESLLKDNSPSLFTEAEQLSLRRGIDVTDLLPASREDTTTISAKLQEETQLPSDDESIDSVVEEVRSTMPTLCAHRCQSHILDYDVVARMQSCKEFLLTWGISKTRTHT